MSGCRQCRVNYIPTSNRFQPFISRALILTDPKPFDLAMPGVPLCSCVSRDVHSVFSGGRSFPRGDELLAGPDCRPLPSSSTVGRHFRHIALKGLSSSRDPYFRMPLRRA